MINIISGSDYWSKWILSALFLLCFLMPLCFITACEGVSEDGVVIGIGYYSQINGRLDQYFVMIETDTGEELLVWLPNDYILLKKLKEAIEADEDIYIECKKKGNKWLLSEIICIGC